MRDGSQASALDHSQGRLDFVRPEFGARGKSYPRAQIIAGAMSWCGSNVLEVWSQSGTCPETGWSPPSRLLARLALTPPKVLTRQPRTAYV